MSIGKTTLAPTELAGQHGSGLDPAIPDPDHTQEKEATVPKTDLLWIEDAQGRWLVDGFEIQTGPKGKVDGEFGIGDGLAGPTPPGKLVLISIEGNDQIRTRFTILGLIGSPAVEK